jgi:hypothetical protein
MERSYAYVPCFFLDQGAKGQLGSERFLAPEILFNPELIGQEDPGVHQVRLPSEDQLMIGDCGLDKPHRSRST